MELQDGIAGHLGYVKNINYYIMIWQLIFLLQALLFLYTGGKNITNRNMYIKIISLIFLYQGLLIVNTIIIKQQYICNYSRDKMPKYCNIYKTISKYIFYISFILLPIFVILSYISWNIIRNNNLLYISTIVLLIYSIILCMLFFSMMRM